MSQLCDLQIHLNAQHTFFLKEDVISEYSGRFRKMIKQAKRRRSRNKNILSIIDIDDFPGGSDGFELVSRFCYSNGKIAMTVSNVSLLHCCSVFLGMTEKISASNLLYQTEKFLEGMFYWSWHDILVCLKSCEPIFTYADSYGLVQKLICALLAKIAQNSDINVFASSSSSSSSPETNGRLRFSSSSKNTPKSAKPSSSSSGHFSCRSSEEWWFNDMAILAPKTIEKLIKNLGAYGTDNNSLILTRFLLQYLKTRVQCKSNRTELMEHKIEYGGLADTAMQGAILVGKTVFSCRKLFWVLRVLSGFSLGRESRVGLERVIGEMLDRATLDDLLISGRDKVVYDVDLVIRLLRVFVNGESLSVQKMKKVGNLIDKYLGEISPDQNLKVSKFLGVAESLPDSARDCFDGVYRAIDIYLESHPNLSFEERSRLCRCLTYEKLTLETCKELAKNPKIPPNIAVQALKSQQWRIPASADDQFIHDVATPISCKSISHHHHHHHEDGMAVITPYKSFDAEEEEDDDDDDGLEDESEEIRMNVVRMQWRVVELEKVCRDIKGQMSKLVRHSLNNSITSPQNKTLPRLC